MQFKFRLTTIILILIGLTILYLVGSLLYFNATIKEQRVIESIASEYRVSEPGFVRESGILSGSRWTDGNHVETLNLGEDIFAAMHEDIASAEKSITKETFNYYGEDVAGPMAEALSAAAERGVDVHFLVDHVGSILAESHKFDRMEEAGVQVVRWRKPAWYQLARFNNRTHRKLLVVDGKVAYTGGANTADKWLPAPEDGGYKDFHFRITGPVVNDIQGAFSENWVASRGVLLTGEKYYPAPDTTGNIPMQVSTSHPQEGQKKVRKMLLYAIASAAERIRIGSAYFFPDENFLDALVAAADRGVAIQILLPGEKIDQNYLRLASQSLWGPLLDAGIEIYEYQPTMYHAKLMIVDDLFVTVGSTNFDNRSFRINDETNVSMLEEEFATAMNNYFDDNLEESIQITREEWENRPAWQKAAGWIVAKVMGPHL